VPARTIASTRGRSKERDIGARNSCDAPNFGGVMAA
jgi:hypothetical protein